MPQAGPLRVRLPRHIIVLDPLTSAGAPAVRPQCCQGWLLSRGVAPNSETDSCPTIEREKDGAHLQEQISQRNLSWQTENWAWMSVSDMMSTLSLHLGQLRQGGVFSRHWHLRRCSLQS